MVRTVLLLVLLTGWACRENQPPPEKVPASSSAVTAVKPEPESANVTPRPKDGGEAQCNPSPKQTGKGCDMAGIILALKPLREPGAAIPACYLKHVQPPSGGKLVLRFALTPDGKAGDWQWTQDDFSSQPLRSCLEAAVSTVQFPLPGDKPCQVVYPFSFIPEVRRARP
jgi:hypothetical protein